MLNLKLNLKYSGVEQKAVMQYKEKVEQIHQELHKRAKDEMLDMNPQNQISIFEAVSK